MDTKNLMSAKLVHASEAMKAPIPEVAAEAVVETMSDKEKRERAEQAYRRVSKLIWHNANNLDGRTLPLDWTRPISHSGNQGTRSVDASPWIDIDTLEDGRVVQTQLQTWRDKLDVYGEHGALLTFSSAEQRPIPSLWLRVRDAEDTVATEAEEVFRLPVAGVAFFHGEHMPGDPDRWEQLDQLITDVETWRAKP